MTDATLRSMLLAATASLALGPVSSWAASAYNQDFEGLDAADGTALADDGWLFFVNLFDGDTGDYLGGYGDRAPNWEFGISSVVTGEGGPDQGLQQLLVFSDYTNQGAHTAGDLLETNVYQEQVIGIEDVGTTWEFSFDAKRGNVDGATTTSAFIKTLDPNAGFFQTNFITFDTTDLPDIWGRFAISLFIGADLNGQILQFGFLSNATDNEPSGVFYDNVTFSQIPTLGGTVAGINAGYALCTNVTEPQTVATPLPDVVLVESWACAPLGLTAAAGDRVRLTAGGRGFTAFFGGRAQGLAEGIVQCNNLTQAVEVTAPLSVEGQWDCTDAGLPVARGDAVQAIVIGNVE
jgi:hypothetical protein